MIVDNNSENHTVGLIRTNEMAPDHFARSRRILQRSPRKVTGQRLALVHRLHHLALKCENGFIKSFMCVPNLLRNTRNTHLPLSSQHAGTETTSFLRNI